ncbi:OmpA family protein [Chakrabartia godavariana]|nr:OmpA family protein [Chakrabartia godavariana]
MRAISNRTAAPVLLALLAVSGVASAQDQDTSNPNIIVNGQEAAPDAAAMAKGPEIKGIVTARKGDRIRVTAADGTMSDISIVETTKIKGSGKNPTKADILNGLPVTVKTMQAGTGLVASQISFKGRDFKTASMIRTGTAQQFAEVDAKAEALRSRMGDIDKYNIKGTTNVYFDTGKWTLSEQAKQELCSTAQQAEATDNALMLVVGYTDSVGSEEYNQVLSEKRASRVINYLQQACHWKPYRMLTPTGMAESDPLASNDTEEGKRQNRRVSVNILVSKSVDGL